MSTTEALLASGPSAGRADPQAPLQLADGVWWVGAVLPDDAFQCHAYLLVNDDESVLLDPGSPVTIEQTLHKVEQVLPLSAIRYVVCHHADPDISAALPFLDRVLPRDDVTLVTEWRAAALLKHYGARFPMYLVEEHGWALPLRQRDSVLEFQLTPYLHFPGAMVSRDASTGVLFSSDLFGGFVDDPTRLVAHDPDDAFAAMRPFHEHYMPSRELLTAGLRRIQRRWPDVSLVAPQHGRVIPGAILGDVVDRLVELECGVFRIAEEDLDLADLLRLAQLRRHLMEALLTTRASLGVLATMTTTLQTIMPLDTVGFRVDLPGEGWVRLDAASGLTGLPEAPQPHPFRLSLPIPGTPASVLELQLTEPWEPTADQIGLLQDIIPTVRVALDRILDARTAAATRADLLTESQTDPLTGVLNRRGLRNADPVGPYCLLMVDLDHFKAVNDEFGHPVGDVLLRRIAGTLVETAPPTALTARLGGEEFLLVVPTSREEAARVGSRVLSAVRAIAVDDLGLTRSATVSIGLAELRPREDFHECLERADAALYTAKNAGRDRLAAAP